MLDFSDRTRTGISKLISRCAPSNTCLLDQCFFCDSVVLELIYHRTRAYRLINESNTTGGLREIWTGPGNKNDYRVSILEVGSLQRTCLLHFANTNDKRKYWHSNIEESGMCLSQGRLITHYKPFHSDWISITGRRYLEMAAKAKMREKYPMIGINMQ